MVENTQTKLDIGEEHVPEPAPRQNWFASHPLSALLGGASVLLLLGIIVVLTHSVPKPTGQTVAWSGEIAPSGGSAIPSGTANNTPTGGIIDQVQGSAPYSYVIPKIGDQNPPATDQQQGSSDSFDYTNFLPKNGSTQQAASTSSSGITDISYAFPPETAFSVATEPTSRTPVQEALYNYGNEVGSYIQTYEQAYPNQTVVLKNQLEDPTNPDKLQVFERMAQALTKIGQSMDSMENVPSQVASAHTAVAKSYETLGQNLLLVPKAQGTDALLQAINIYNASANAFAENFAKLAGVFATYGVSYTADEAGSEFMFTYSY